MGRRQRAAVLASLRAEVKLLREQAQAARVQRQLESEARRREVEDLAKSVHQHLEQDCRQPRLQHAKQAAQQRKKQASGRRLAVAEFLDKRQRARHESREAAAFARREQSAHRERTTRLLRAQTLTECRSQWIYTKNQRTQALCRIYMWVETFTGVRRRPPCDPCRQAAGQAAQAVDNLQRIEGIGPKSAKVLQGSGITTFATLAHTPATRLREILHAAGSRFRGIDPTTWPEQAKLAALGKFDVLGELQKNLVAGRRRKRK